ncbi:hypothetical protein FB45DRAFT_1007859 [Roridomyces roridus]|uniref:Uncharacterized protein n=1 Tax=Roridomyces roridus TaxID=1738132 RepID=A0AAD7BCN0_9AGAR|nr:hypothetical protein FB45DRAFT_1007859 [Roridomyces roridus]
MPHVSVKKCSFAYLFPNGAGARGFFNAYRGPGSPDKTLGSPGDTYVDVISSPPVVYAHEQVAWTRVDAGMQRLQRPISHPNYPELVLQVNNEKTAWVTRSLVGEEGRKRGAGNTRDDTSPKKKARLGNVVKVKEEEKEDLIPPPPSWMRCPPLDASSRPIPVPTQPSEEPPQLLPIPELKRPVVLSSADDAGPSLMVTSTGVLESSVQLLKPETWTTADGQVVVMTFGNPSELLQNPNPRADVEDDLGLPLSEATRAYLSPSASLAEDQPAFFRRSSDELPPSQTTVTSSLTGIDMAGAPSSPSLTYPTHSMDTNGNDSGTTPLASSPMKSDFRAEHTLPDDELFASVQSDIVLNSDSTIVSHSPSAQTMDIDIKEASPDVDFSFTLDTGSDYISPTPQFKSPSPDTTTSTDAVDFTTSIDDAQSNSPRALQSWRASLPSAAAAYISQLEASIRALREERDALAEALDRLITANAEEDLCLGYPEFSEESVEPSGGC